MRLQEALTLYFGGPGSGPRPGQGRKGFIRDHGRRAEDSVRHSMGEPGSARFKQSMRQFKQRQGMYEGLDRRSGKARRWEAKATDTTSVKRINNPAPSDGPEIYETRSRRGQVLGQFRDKVGAENARESAARKDYKFSNPPVLQWAKNLRDGNIQVMDERQRRTGAAGSGGAVGPANG